MGSRATRHAPGLSPDLLYNTTRVLIRNPFSKATFKPHLYNPSRRVLLSQKIYKDMKAIFGLTPLEQHTILIFRAYTIENPQAALKWLSEEGGITPHTSHFETTMRGFAYKHDMKGMKELIWNIKNTGGCITSDLYAPLVLSSFPPNSDLGNPSVPDISPDLSHARAILDEIEKEGIQLSAKLISDLIFQYRTFGSIEDVQSLADHLKIILSRQAQKLWPNEEKDATAALLAAAAMSAKTAGNESPYSSALREAKTLLSQGFHLGSRSLVVLLETEDAPMMEAEDIVTLATSLAIGHELSNVVVWGVAIRRAIKRDAAGLGDGSGLDRALRMYDEAVKRRVLPNSALVDPLVHALCSRKSPPDSADVNDALQLYYDLRDAEGKGPFAKSHTGRRYGPDQSIYMILLGAISRTPPTSNSSGTSASDIIIQLLIDMRDSGLSEPLPPTFIRDIFTRLLLLSPSHDASFKLYTYLREINPSLLDRTGYEQILLQFTKLSFEDDPLPDQAHYMNIVKDMRHAGIPMTSFVYNSLFSRYAALAKTSAEVAFGSSTSAEDVTAEQERAMKLRKRLLQATRKLHRTLKLDAGVNPEIVTFNTLMNAYNYLGAFGDAFEVWEQLTLGFPVSYDNISISILLDICGYARNPDAADHVWGLITSKTMSSHRVRPNANNWLARMECFARIGDFSRVMEIFKEMHAKSKEEPSVPSPNEATIELLTKFGRTFGREGDVTALLESEMPNMYSSILSKQPLGEEA